MPDITNKMVDGVAVPLTDKEKQAIKDAQKRLSDEAPKRQAAANILSLEDKITPRRIRDAFASDEGKKWVADVEAEIAKERAKL